MCIYINTEYWRELSFKSDMFTLRSMICVFNISYIEISKMPFEKRQKKLSEKVFEKKHDLNDLTENHVIKSIKDVNLQYLISRLARLS